VNYFRQKVNLILFPLLFLSLSCGSNSDSQNSTVRVDKAIAEGNYDLAIEILEGELAARPSDDQIRLELASVYAVRSGLPLNNFIELGRTLVKTTRDVDRYYEEKMAEILNQIKRHAKNQSEIDILNTLEKVYSITLQLSTILRQFESVPVLRSQAQIKDVNLAIDVLSQSPSPKGGLALYRALLRTALLRHRLEHDTDELKIRNCKINLSKASQLLTVIHQDVRDILWDLSLASVSPRRQMELKESVARLDKGIDRALKHLWELKKFEEATLIEVPKLIYGKCKK